MTKPETIKIDDMKYVRKNSAMQCDSPIKIVILQRGWVMIGRFERDGSECKLHNASVIRKWGTSKGLGELFDGPLSGTKLDKCNGLVEFDYLTVVATISVSEEAWEKGL